MQQQAGMAPPTAAQAPPTAAQATPPVSQAPPPAPQVVLAASESQNTSTPAEQQPRVFVVASVGGSPETAAEATAAVSLNGGAVVNGNDELWGADPPVVRFSDFQIRSVGAECGDAGDSRRQAASKPEPQSIGSGEGSSATHPPSTGGRSPAAELCGDAAASVERFAAAAVVMGDAEGGRGEGRAEVRLRKKVPAAETSGAVAAEGDCVTKKNLSR